MGPKSKLHLSRIFLSAAILLIVAFQLYWLNRLYKEEWTNLKKETNGIFRDVVYKMQVDRFKNDTLIFRKNGGENLFVFNAVNALRKRAADLGNKIKKEKGDSVKAETIWFNTNDSAQKSRRIEIHQNGVSPEITQMLMNREAGTMKIREAMDTALLRRMAQHGTKVVVSFNHSKTDTTIIRSGKLPPPELISKVIVQNKTYNKKAQDSLPVKINAANIQINGGTILPPEKAFVRLITSGKALDDSLPVKKLDSVYTAELKKAGIPISFTIQKGKDDSLHKKDSVTNRFATSPAVVGFINPYWYQASFENPVGFLLKKISLQILFSVFLVTFTTVAFIFLYRNLLAQRRLTEMKNDLITNITHELKTPVATVSVAVEALRNFGGMENPARTKEYLDISAAELQRLNLLIDKVLKLSLFENREMELTKEDMDLRLLTEEVLNSMKLQFDSHKATLHFEVQGNYFRVHADRLHITSVIFNLLDNAIKYSTGKPDITVRLQHLDDSILLQVADKGIGITPGDQPKIFDKFFRVPSGDRHNIKGYGLGLSYVAHVIGRHNGTVSVQSTPGEGSTFTIKLPVA